MVYTALGDCVGCQPATSATAVLHVVATSHGS